MSRENVDYEAAWDVDYELPMTLRNMTDNGTYADWQLADCDHNWLDMTTFGETDVSELCTICNMRRTRLRCGAPLVPTLVTQAYERLRHRNVCGHDDCDNLNHYDTDLAPAIVHRWREPGSDEDLALWHWEDCDAL